MREQRHRDSRHGSPPWRPGIRESGRLSPSYLSPTYSRPEPDRSRQAPARAVPTSGGDVRSFCASQSRNPESGEFRQDLYFSGLNRINNPVQPERSPFGTMGSVPAPYSAEREMQRRKMAMSGFSESVVGIGDKSASRKFQWDNLLVDNDKPANYANSVSNRNSYGGFCDSGVVPVSMSSENNGGGSSIPRFDRRIEASESCRNYGVMDGRYAYSSPNPFGVRGRTSIVDSIVDKIEGDKNMDMDIDNESTFIRNNLMNERRRMLFENDTCFAENEKDVDCKGLKVNPEFVEDFSFPRNESNARGCSVYEDVVERIPMLYEQFDDSSGNSYQQLAELQESIELRLEQNRIDNQKLLLPHHWNAIEDTFDSTSGGDRDWTSEEIEQFAMLENSGRAMYQDRSRRSSATDAMAVHGNSFSSADVVSMSRRSSKSSKRDVRQRLGPALSVKQRLEFPPLVGKRQISSKNNKKYPWLKQVRVKTLEDKKVSVQEVKVEDDKPNEDDKQKEDDKPGPREDSEEFKNKVQRAFLKVFKLLNKNSTDLRRYLDQGGAGRFKCCICGSSSKEFVDTIGLAQHAFFSYKSRPEHLGLYKAICVLMGWDSTIVVNGKWIQQILPFAEASSSREDLIIWPPVVLIHNSSIANDGKDNLMTVSIEGLKHILRGMGCDPMMISICHGKAADQSSMVVSFSGTFSGLQEAEKLHKIFSKRQQGRHELLQIRSSGCCKMDHQETRNRELQQIRSSGCCKMDHQETRNRELQQIHSSSCCKMDHQETRNRELQQICSSGCCKMDHQETRNHELQQICSSGCGKMDHQETRDRELHQICSSGCCKMDHQETQNCELQQICSSGCGKMDHQETQNRELQQICSSGCCKTNHQETRDCELQQIRSIGCCKTDHQETRDCELQQIRSSGCCKIDHQETQNCELQKIRSGGCYKMDHQETRDRELQQICSTGRCQMGHQETRNSELQQIYSSGFCKMDHQETRNLELQKICSNGCCKMDHQETRNRELQQICPSGCCKMDHQDTRNCELQQIKTHHQETLNCELQQIKMDHQETRNCELQQIKTDHLETLNCELQQLRPSCCCKTDHQETQSSELQQIRSGGCCCKTDNQETRNVLVDNIESFLYGYMGIASDLDELDSDIKRRSVVRSKKEMEAIAKASLRTQ